MTLTRRVTFVAAVNDRTVLQQNLLASPCVGPARGHQLLIQEQFPSAARAYNDAIQKAENDLIIFVHQDMFLPETWFSQLESNLAYLGKTDPDWGVIGCWGATRNGKFRGHVYSTGLGVLGGEFENPMPVQTLDEIVLIFRKSTGLLFDDALPHFHFYGTDICLRSAVRRLNCYAISAFCIHNTRQLLDLPKEFYNCYDYVRRVWRDQLPIQTTCIRVSRSNFAIQRRRLEDAWRTMFLPGRHPVQRAFNPAEIVTYPDIVNANGRTRR